MKNAIKRVLVYFLTLVMTGTLFVFPVMAESPDLTPAETVIFDNTEPALQEEMDLEDSLVSEDVDRPEEEALLFEDVLLDETIKNPALQEEPDVKEEQEGQENPEVKEEMDVLAEEESLSLQASGVAKGTLVSGSFTAVDNHDIATVRYYLDAGKQNYGFADFSYNDSTKQYEYSFAAPYDGFEVAEATSIKPNSNATVIAQYYSLTKWDGAVDVSWYNETDADFYLYTPAQLAGFAAIVNGSVDGGIEDYQVKGDRSSPEDRSVNRGLPDVIKSVLKKDARLIANITGDAYKGVREHDFANRTVHIMKDMDMGGVPGDQIDHSKNSWDRSITDSKQLEQALNHAHNAYDYPNWTPIGGEYLMDVSEPDSMIIAFFNGTIEGHGHYINNLYCYRWAYNVSKLSLKG